MPWDGVRRRSEDNGSESPDTILARIDERVKNMNDKLTTHMIDFTVHKKEDDNNFKGLYKIAWGGGGIFAFVSFLILLFKH